MFGVHKDKHVIYIKFFEMEMVAWCIHLLPVEISFLPHYLVQNGQMALK